MSIPMIARGLPLALAVVLVDTNWLVPGAAAQGRPALAYDPPANFYRGASVEPVEFSSNEVDAGVQVYAFRPITGNIDQLFQQTLLRDWIDPRYRETNVMGRMIWGRDTLPGAQRVLTVQFLENVSGNAHAHMRMVIIAPGGGAAAIVDASANSQYSWERSGPAVRAMFASFKVVSSTPPASVAVNPSGAETRAMAGIYMGSKGHYKANLNRPGGNGDWVTSLHFYFFSPDGRVYRTFDPPALPGNDVRRLDFDALERTDPENTGRYGVQGNQLVVMMGGPQPQRLTTSVPRGGGPRLVIESIVYVKQ